MNGEADYTFPFLFITIFFNFLACHFLGAQFGTVISMPLSGLLSECRFGWPSIFYVFGIVGTVWCVFFLIFIHEDPQSNTKMNVEERLYIQKQLGSKLGLPVSWLLLYFKNQTQQKLILFLDTTNSMVFNSKICSLLGHPSRTHGS